MVAVLASGDNVETGPAWEAELVDDVERVVDEVCMGVLEVDVGLCVTCMVATVGRQRDALETPLNVIVARLER